MRAVLLIAGLLAGCVTPEPVPDVFSPAAHGAQHELYRPHDAVLWTYRYDAPDDLEVMRYLVPADDQGFTPGAQ